MEQGELYIITSMFLKQSFLWLITAQNQIFEVWDSAFAYPMCVWIYMWMCVCVCVEGCIKEYRAFSKWEKSLADIQEAVGNPSPRASWDWILDNILNEFGSRFSPIDNVVGTLSLVFVALSSKPSQSHVNKRMTSESWYKWMLFISTVFVVFNVR